MASASHIRHRTAPRPGASLQGGSCVQHGRDHTISQGHPVIACIACMRSHTHTHTHTHTANNRNDRSAPHAARMQHPPRHHREVLRRSSGAARKDSCVTGTKTFGKRTFHSGSSRRGGIVRFPKVFVSGAAVLPAVSLGYTEMSTPHSFSVRSHSFLNTSVIELHRF